VEKVKNRLTLFAILFLIASLLAISTDEAFALKSDATEYGTISIDGDLFSISGDSFTLLQITGEIEDPKSGVRVIMDLVKPDGTIDKIETIPNSEGFYTTTLLLDQDWEEGLYTLNAFYIENDLGTVTFEIAEVSPIEIFTISDIGGIEIEYEEYTKSEGVPLNVKITGTIIDYVDETEVLFTVVFPNGETSEFIVFAQRTGELKARITVQDDWPIGVYQVSTVYEEQVFGKESFVLKKTQVPVWIKNNAEWWAAGQIDDQTFVSGIQFLLEQKIIDISDLPPSASTTSEEKLPDWIKNNAKWWSEGRISEDDFVNGIKYLVEKGIIRV